MCVLLMVVSPIKLKVKWYIPGDNTLTCWLSCNKDHWLGAIKNFLRLIDHCCNSEALDLGFSDRLMSYY